MDFNHTEERRMLAETIGRVVRDEYDIETRHANAKAPTGFSPEMWGKFAELGMIGALFDEADGGFGGAGYDIAVVFEELGRGLVVEPFLASAVLGGGLLSMLGNDAQKAMIEEIIAGGRLVAFAHGEPGGFYDLAEVTATAVRHGEGWELNGDKAVVINGDSADTLIVSARIEGDRDDEDGIGLFLVDPSASGVTVRGYGTVDGGRAAEISLRDVHVGDDAVLGAPGGAYPAIEAVVGRAIVALCAEAVGAMEVAKDMTLEYLRTRKQFGVAIGRFQALQHRMAEVLIEIEQARSAVINAAAALTADRTTRERTLSAAKNMIGRVGRLVSEESIQMHGGIGMTWEYALPHFAKRIVMIDHQFGDTDHHLERFIRFNRGAA